jgi:hypothetical protein
VLQDTSGGSTWVNGNPIEGPTPLCVGDVITLGADASPATVEVDPAGVDEGRQGYPAESQEAAAAAAAAVAIAPSPAPMRRGPAQAAVPPRPPGGYYAGSPQMPPQPVAAANQGWGGEAEDSIAGWQQAGPTDSSGSTTTVRRKPKKNTSNAGLMVGIAVCVVLVGLFGFIIYKVTNPDVPKAAPKAAAAPSGPVDRSDNIFGIGTNGENGHSKAESSAPSAPHFAAPAPAPDSSDTSSTPAPSPSPAAAPDPSNPEGNPVIAKSDAAWEEMEGAHISPNFGLAILKFDDYRRQHPGQHTAELDNYLDEAMDKLWWKRISGLCAKRDSINKDIKKNEKDTREETSAAFKKTLAAEKKGMTDKLALVQQHLNSEMGYTSEETPDLDNRDTMDKLTAARDASKFGAWKLSTLKYIRNNHGATPWDGE